MSVERLIVENPEVELAEAREVLLVLENLLTKVTSPFVRVCLEEIHEDIAHLAGEEEAA
jgi:hypothetical protein